MNTALLLSLTSFAFVSSATPGPNNLLLMSSGALFGWKKTVPHLTGILLGVAILNMAAIFGLGAVVDKWPWLITLVRILGATWLAWMSVRFFQAARRIPATNVSERSPQSNNTMTRPFHFYEAALFQWVNPKALIITLSAAGAYIAIAETPIQRALIVTLVFLVSGFISCSAWTIAGDALNRYLSSGHSARYINFAMGLLILLTALHILVG